jgi:hypothetical protein
MQTDIHASSWIQTNDISVGAHALDREATVMGHEHNTAKHIPSVKIFYSKMS